MKISIFANQNKQIQLQKLLRQLACEHIFYESYDDFIAEVSQDKGDVLIVARDGAEGMESARAAKILLPDTPIVWFSDDKGFCPESYRIGCAYFSAQPITEEVLIKALKRCDIEMTKGGC